MENFQLSVPEASAATRISVILPINGFNTIHTNYTKKNKINLAPTWKKIMVFNTIRMDHNEENAELHLHILSEKDELEFIAVRSG